jgi:hypothetical protein|tara:strand:- start:540 stop:668 length:129 start_codon:yes stop_codon:yes gene_type:complete
MGIFLLGKGLIGWRRFPPRRKMSEAISGLPFFSGFEFVEVGG